MRELSLTQQETLLELLVDGRNECALVTLIGWAEEQTVDEDGNGSEALNHWDVSHAVPSLTSPTAADLDEIDSALWLQASAIQLVQCLEQRIVDGWPAHPQVSCWKAVEGVEYWLLGKHAPPPTRNDRIVGTARWLKLLRVVPCRIGAHRVVLHPAEQPTNDRLKRRAGSHSGMIGHFEDGIEVSWSPLVPGFVAALGLSDGEARFDSAVRLLTAAEGCTFFVLPECTMPASLRLRLANEIPACEVSPCLSVLGSFHDHAPSCNPPYQNRAELHDYRGSVLFSVVKTARASVRHPDNPNQQLDEYISLRNELHALVTDIGLVGVTICLDFSHPNGLCHASWSKLAPEWMLVPSMGANSTVDLQRGVAGQLADTHRTVSLVANQPPSGGGVMGFIRDRGLNGSSDWVAVAQTPNVTNCVRLLST